MSTAVKMPQLGESVVEGAIVRWLKAPGEHVAKYEPLLEISTDKIDTEVPSPAEGTLLEILTPEGQSVTVGTILAYIGQPNEKPMPVAPTSAPITKSPSHQVTKSLGQDYPRKIGLVRQVGPPSALNEISSPR